MGETEGNEGREKWKRGQKDRECKRVRKGGKNKESQGFIWGGGRKWGAFAPPGEFLPPPP